VLLIGFIVGKKFRHKINPKEIMIIISVVKMK